MYIMCFSSSFFPVYSSANLLFFRVPALWYLCSMTFGCFFHTFFLYHWTKSLALPLYFYKPDFTAIFYLSMWSPLWYSTFISAELHCFPIWLFFYLKYVFSTYLLVLNSLDVYLDKVLPGCKNICIKYKISPFDLLIYKYSSTDMRFSLFLIRKLIWIVTVFLSTHTWSKFIDPMYTEKYINNYMYFI